MKKSSIDMLSSYVDALRPIIYINHFDFRVIDEAIDCIGENVNILEFNNALGMVDFKTKSPMQECNLEEFLKLVREDGY